MPGGLRRVGSFIPEPVETIKVLPDDVGPNVKAIWIEPVDDSLIQGELKVFAEKVGAKTARIPGYWYYSETSPDLPGKTGGIIPKAREHERVGLMLHGGGFMMQSAHPTDVSQNITRGILERSDCFTRILAVEYRRLYGIDELMGPKAAKNTFPTSLLDAISGYYYLVSTVGFKPQNVFLIGDSAGGNLALALTRYILSTNGVRPGGLILLSPWTDLGPSHYGRPEASTRRLASSDYTGQIPNLEEAMVLGGQAYTHPFGDRFCATNPYVSPTSKLLPEEIVRNGRVFAGFPPSLIISGGAEVLLDSIVSLVQQMREGIGNENVEYLECEDAFHDFLMFLFAEPERTQALHAISKWLNKITTYN